MVNIGIANDAFLQTGSKLMVMLDSVELVNRELLISAQTPKIFVETVMINVTEQYANGEIGFSNKTVLTVDEPDAEPLTLTLELRRKGTTIIILPIQLMQIMISYHMHTLFNV